MDDIIKVLLNGGHIWYAPIKGGIMLMEDDMVQSDVKITIKDFLCLRGQNVIEFKSFMRQGHFLFRGRADLYELHVQYVGTTEIMPYITYDELQNQVHAELMDKIDKALVHLP